MFYSTSNHHVMVLKMFQSIHSHYFIIILIYWQIQLTERWNFLSRSSITQNILALFMVFMVIVLWWCSADGQLIRLCFINIFLIQQLEQDNTHLYHSYWDREFATSAVTIHWLLFKLFIKQKCKTSQMGEFAADLYYCKLNVDFVPLVYENN